MLYKDALCSIRWIRQSGTDRPLWLTWVLVSLLLSACGLKTPPQPQMAPPELKWVNTLSVRQRGEAIRFAWSLGEQLPLPVNSNQPLRFRILPYRLTYPCLDCEPVPEPALELSPEHAAQLKSGREWRLDFLIEPGDLHTPAYALEIWHPQEGLVERTPSVALQARALFPQPAPPLLQRLASGAVRISWQSPGNPRQFTTSQKSLTAQGYAANVYGSSEREAFNESLLNTKPVLTAGWLFSPSRGSGAIGENKQKMTSLSGTQRLARSTFWIALPPPPEDTWYFSLRWVDRFGNESLASEAVTISLPATVPPQSWRMFWPLPLVH